MTPDTRHPDANSHSVEELRRALASLQSTATCNLDSAWDEQSRRIRAQRRTAIRLLSRPGASGLSYGRVLAFAAAVIALVAAVTFGSIAIVHSSGSGQSEHHSQSTVLSTMQPLPHPSTTVTPKPPPTTTTKPPPSSPVTITTTPYEESGAQMTPTGMTLQFTSLDEGWTSADDGQSIRETTDGGHTWRTRYTPSKNLLVKSLDFVDDRHGWAIIDMYNATTPFGYLIRTVDGGNTWQDIGTPSEGAVAFMDFVSPSVGWVITDDEEVIKTNDGGSTWSAVPTPIRAASLCAESGGTTWMAGVNKDIYLSSDSGQTWQMVLPLSELPPHLANMPRRDFEAPEIACSGATAWAQYPGDPGAGTQPYVIEGTVDGGTHWTTLQLPASTDFPSGFPSFFGLTSPSDGWALGSCFACSDNNVGFASTTDGGGSFRGTVVVQDPGLNETNPTGSSFVDRDHGWVITGVLTLSTSAVHQELFATSDGGVTWHVVDPSLF